MRMKRLYLSDSLPVKIAASLTLQPADGSIILKEKIKAKEYQTAKVSVASVQLSAHRRTKSVVKFVLTSAGKWDLNLHIAYALARKKKDILHLL